MSDNYMSWELIDTVQKAISHLRYEERKRIFGGASCYSSFTNGKRKSLPLKVIRTLHYDYKVSLNLLIFGAENE